MKPWKGLSRLNLKQVTQVVRRKKLQEKRKREGAFFKLLQRQVVTMWKIKVKQSSYYYTSWPFMDSLLLNP